VHHTHVGKRIAMVWGVTVLGLVATLFANLVRQRFQLDEQRKPAWI
jgi:hypothetical protein